MLIAAFLLMVITPKLAAQDPQMQKVSLLNSSLYFPFKDMQNLQLPKMDMPDMADMLANMFGSSSGKKGNTRKAIASQNTKRTTR